LAQQLRASIRQANLDACFQFTGLVGPERIPALVGAMDILVHASLREGLARALPQALIAGKPVISFNVDGAREVVIDDETGVLVAPKRVDLLAEGICRLAADRALRERLGAQGRLRFTDRFRHEHMSQQLRSLYERILAAHGSTSFTSRALLLK
ncbi:MAG: glycosyltransferase, partial [Pirellulales bacterium]